MIAQPRTPLLWPAPSGRLFWPQRRIHMPAFFGALILAPLIGSAAWFFLVIPVFALIFGLPLYFALGTPTLLVRLGRGPATGYDTAFLAFLVNLLACLMAGIAAMVAQDEHLGTLAVLYLVFGSLVAPIWGGAFGWLYRRFTRRNPAYA